VNLLRYFSGDIAQHTARNSPEFYYDPRRRVDEYSALFQVPAARVEAMRPAARAALYVIWSNAMRASEYLSLQVRDVMGNDRCFVRGAKGSGSYIIVLPDISRQVLAGSGGLPARFVAGLTYSQLYRSCVRADIGARVMERLNLARTHLARYTLALEVKGHGIKAVQECLRHRSGRSTLHYVGA
jgi:integrase